MATVFHKDKKPALVNAVFNVTKKPPPQLKLHSQLQMAILDVFLFNANINTQNWFGTLKHSSRLKILSQNFSFYLKLPDFYCKFRCISSLDVFLHEELRVNFSCNYDTMEACNLISNLLCFTGKLATNKVIIWHCA